MGAIAVLRFTDGPEAEASLVTATDMHSILGNDAFIVELSQNTWPETLERLAPDTVCLLATHGGVGENGTLQGYLESRSIRHSHSSSSVSAMLCDKHLTKLLYTALDIPTPGWNLPHKNLKGDAIEKPRFGGSKAGLRRAVFSRITTVGTHAIQETPVDGTLEVSVVVLRDGNTYRALTPIERRRTSTLGELHLAPKTIDDRLLEACRKYALTIANQLGAGGVIKTDFLIDKANTVWAIETDAIPGLGKQNATALAAEQSGISYTELIKKLIEGAS